MYKFRDEFDLDNYIEERNSFSEVHMEYREDYYKEYIYNVNHYYNMVLKHKENKPKFNSKDYLETIKRKDR
jgi:hypothetical protein